MRSGVELHLSARAPARAELAHFPDTLREQLLKGMDREFRGFIQLFECARFIAVVGANGMNPHRAHGAHGVDGIIESPGRFGGCAHGLNRHLPDARLLFGASRLIGREKLQEVVVDSRANETRLDIASRARSDNGAGNARRSCLFQKRLHAGKRACLVAIEAHQRFIHHAQNVGGVFAQAIALMKDGRTLVARRRAQLLELLFIQNDTCLAGHPAFQFIPDRHRVEQGSIAIEDEALRVCKIK